MTEERSSLVVDGDTSGAQKALAGLDRSVAGSEQAVEDLSESFGEAGEEGESSFDSIASAADSMKGQLAVAAAAAAAVAAAVKFVGDETARLDRIAKGAQQTGLGFKTYQELEQVATLSGTSIENLGKATLKLTRGLNEVADGGGKKITDNLARVGLTFDMIADRSPTEQLAILSDALKGVESDSQRTAIAAELLGKSGADLVPLLNSGSEAIEEMAANVGRVFTREELARAEAYQDALANLNKASADVAGQLALSLAPTLQGVVEGLTESAAAFGDSEILADGLGLAINRLEALLAPLASTAGLIVDVLGVLGNTVNFVTDELGAAGRAAQSFGEGVRETLAETQAGQWASEQVAALGELTDEGLGPLTEAIEEQLPFVEELGDKWDVLKNTILGTNEAAGQLLTRPTEKLAELLEQARDAARELGDEDENRVEALEDIATQAGHAVRLAQAQKRPAAELEALFRAQHRAKLDLLRATGDQAKLEKAVRDEEVRQVKAANAGRGRGRRRDPNEALDRETAALLGNLDARAQVLAAEQKAAAGQEEAIEAQERLLEVERERLDVREFAADLRITRGADENAKVEAELLDIATERQIAQIEAEQLARDQREGAADDRLVQIDREIERLQALGIETGLLEQQRRSATAAFIEQFGTAEESAAAAHDAEILRIEQLRAAEVAVAESELEQFTREMELAGARGIQTQDLALQRIELERAVAEAEGDTAKVQELLHKQEVARIEDRVRRQRQALAATSSLLSAGQQFGSLIVNAAIKDEKKREKASLRARGVEALARGALETVEAVSSFAGFNFVQGALHTAAAAVAFTQGGLMLAGRIPGRSSASAAAGGGAAPAPVFDQGSSSRPTSDTPVSAEEFTRITGGGEAASATTGGAANGGTTIVVRDSTIVSTDAGTTLSELGEQTQQRWGT